MSLALLDVYDSSDDELADIDSSKATGTSHKRNAVDIEETNPPVKRRLPIPKLPAFQENRAITRCPEDDKTKHQNRTRSFAHEPGNWATYVYIPIKCTEDLCGLAKDIQDCLAEFNLQIAEDFHVSLTKTVSLRHHWISGFIDSVRTNLCGANIFHVNFHGLKVYVNDNKTRTFIGLEVNDDNCVLQKLVNKLDQSLQEFNLPVFYENPSFHISLLWCVGNFYSEIAPKIDVLKPTVKAFQVCVKVDNLLCCCGNKNFCFPFK